MPTVLAMGGSVVTNNGPEYLRQLAEALDTASRDEPLFVVIGGGTPARQAIEIARPAGGTEEMLDRIGIQATRLNAQTMIALLAAQGVPVNDDVPHDVASAAAMADTCRVILMGGTTPGHSTDYVGAELAQHIGAQRLIIATNVDGVYSKDPRKHDDAERLERLDHQGLLKICGSEWTSAGQAGVVDGPASALLVHSQIETRVIDGTDLANLALALSGEPFSGTLIQSP